MNRDIKLFVKDIISAMDSIEKFVSGMTIDELERDDKTASAVIRKFEIIGEATKHIPDAPRSKHSEIPWSRMSGMRDRLVHAYFGIDYKLVWDAKTGEGAIVEIKDHSGRSCGPLHTGSA